MADENTINDDEFEGAFKDLGMTVSGELMVPKPPDGEHLWVLPVWYKVDLAMMNDDDEEPMGSLTISFGNHNMAMAGTVGCLICRYGYDTMKGEPCPGAPDDGSEL